MNMRIEDLPEKLRRQAEGKIKAQSVKTIKTEELLERTVKNEQRRKQRLTEASEAESSRSKYGNIACEVNGIRFDSKKESRRYLELKGMMDAGQISDLKLQHHFTLSEAFKTADGETVRRTEYIADFTYFDSDGRFIIEDVKSAATRKNPVYSLKKRLMASAGWAIREV